MSRVVIALGSNLGDRESLLRGAVRALGDIPGTTVDAVSGLVETSALKPEGIDEDAPAYLNAVAIVRTGLTPRQLLTELHEIERAHGRVREQRWGDRTLDLDIIVFDDVALDSPELTLPHPRAGERDFVLAPWAQLEPDAELPGLGRIAALIDEVPAAYPAEPLQ